MHSRSVRLNVDSAKEETRLSFLGSGGRAVERMGVLRVGRYRLTSRPRETKKGGSDALRGREYCPVQCREAWHGSVQNSTVQYSAVQYLESCTAMCCAVLHCAVQEYCTVLSPWCVHEWRTCEGEERGLCGILLHHVDLPHVGIPVLAPRIVVRPGLMKHAGIREGHRRVPRRLCTPRHTTESRKTG